MTNNNRIAYFVLEENPLRGSPQGVAARFSDSNGIVSERIASITTAHGKEYSLMPDPQKPWLKIEDSGPGCFYGSMQNTSLNAGEIFKTDPVLKCKTVSGKEIIVMLEMARKPQKQPITRFDMDAMIETMRRNGAFDVISPSEDGVRQNVYDLANFTPPSGQKPN